MDTVRALSTKSQKIYETDQMGRALFGFVETLRQAALDGGDLRLGLDAHTYEERLPFLSLAVTPGAVVGIQPFGKASANVQRFLSDDKPSFLPYDCSFVYSSDCHFSIIRRRLDGTPLGSTGPVFNSYKYYRWFADTAGWTRLYDSSDTSERGRAHRGDIEKTLKECGFRLKVAFELGGATYMLTPNIVYFKDGRITAKTLPVVIPDHGTHSDFAKYKKLSLVEFIVGIDGGVVAYDYADFTLTPPDRKPPLGTRILNRVLPASSSLHGLFSKKIRPRQLEWNIPVRWYAKT